MARPVAIVAFIALAGSGCAVIAPMDNPSNIRVAEIENPVLVTPGEPTGTGYGQLYEAIIDVLDDDFEIKPTSRYSGQIETFPRVAPGFEQRWKGGSPSLRERLLATNQSLRHRAIVQILAGDRGGFRVYVEVYKDLEDLPQPIGIPGSSIPTGTAVFSEAPTVDRRNEVIGIASGNDYRWIPAGRDCAYEQRILQKIRDRAARPRCGISD